MVIATVSRSATTAAPRTPKFHVRQQPVDHSPKDGFEGFGAEFNPYVFVNRPDAAAAISRKVNALNPRDVRIFVPPAGDPAVAESFFKSVELAVKEGANLNLTLNGLMSNNNKLDDAQWNKHRTAMVNRFSEVIDEVKRRNGGVLPKGLHVTFDNEAGGTPTFEQAMREGKTGRYAKRYAEGYAALDARLNASGQRDVKLVAGDLTKEHRTEFLKAMKGTGIEKHIDAWSFHCYPRFNESLEGQVKRLQDIRALADELHLTKPLCINEMGIKGYGKFVRSKDGSIGNPPGNPGRTEPYTYTVKPDGTIVNHPHGLPIESTGKAAFQQGWFALAAARLGFQGAIKWEAFDGGKHEGYAPGEFGMIDKTGEQTTPSYSMFRMFDSAVPAGWTAMRGSGAQGGERATLFRGPNGGVTALAMNQATSTDAFRADGFPDGTVHVAVWTQDGRLRYSTAQVVGGNVQVNIPAGGAIAVSTQPFAR